jgi:hypothetical protein
MYYWPQLANIRALQVMLTLIRTLAVCISLTVSLLIPPLINADTTDILVHKGELRFVLPVDQARNSMLIQHRSRTRNIARIVLDGLKVTNTRTNKQFRLQDRITNLANDMDDDGYWTTDILYDGLNFSNDSYRVEGRLTLFLIRSVKTRNFNVYLRPKSYDWPSNSSIDWDKVD